MKKLGWNGRGLPALLLGVMAFLLMFGNAWAATPQVKVQSKSVQLVFDGKTLALPQGQYVFMVNNTNYVPLKFFSNALRKSVKWEAKTKTVTVNEPTAEELVLLQDYFLASVAKQGQLSSKGGVQLKVSTIQAKFIFEGKAKVLPKGQSAYIVNGSMYVPIRFMSESVGTNIQWDGKAGRITAESAAYKKEKLEGQQDPWEGTGDPPSAGGDGGTIGGGGAGGGAGGGGGTPAKPSYESITGNAESQLHALENSCINQLMGIASSASGASAEKKEELKSQGQAVVSQCTASFNQIVNDTEQLLKTNEYSTGIIQQFRDYFNKQLAAGQAILESFFK
ncbi:copper amine oxidase N-terminal domain-containing protein [Cohnella pontilimi]|nr:copper amine oxidase N-terminal domain-containing protein [Cohnella pontilimi]